MSLLQCGKVWKTSPITRHHPPELWRIVNWQTSWMSFTVGLKNTPHPWTPLHTPISTSINPPLPHTCTDNKWRWHAPGLQREQKETPGSDSVSPACFKTCADQPAPIFTKIFNITGAVWSPHTSNLHNHPHHKETQNTGLNDYRHVALTSVVMKSFERLVLAYMKASTGRLLDPLQFATEQTGLWMMQSTWDCTSSCSIWTDQGLMWGSSL